MNLVPRGVERHGDDDPRRQAAVWAGGNVVDPRAQVITAAGAGSAAAIAINAGR
jgi:NADPH-dependent glutamate synthase beta subunit-like oxidoreductase